jgi:L-fuconolactonase
VTVLSALPVLDCHTHVIASDRDRYPLDVDPELLPGWVHEHPVDAPRLLAEMTQAGVAGAVLVQARGAYGYDNSYAADARAVAPERLVNAAVVDMAAPDRWERLAYWSGERGVLGVRLFNIPPADPDWFGAAGTAELVRRWAGQGIRISVCVLAPDLPAIARLLAAAPEAVISVDHCGFPVLDADLRSPDTEALAALAARPNVRLKVTTTLLHQAVAAGVAATRMVEWLAARFGADRLMWGSDYPQHHSESYAEIVEYGRAACSGLTRSEQEAFLAGTAAEVWPELAG